MNPRGLRRVTCGGTIDVPDTSRPESAISKAFESQRDEFSVAQEKAILVSIALPDRPWLTSDPCAEIRGLAESAGAKVVGELTQKRHDIQLGTYIGSGKLGELGELVEQTEADVVIFDNDLTPAQGRNLEKALNVKVLDRSEVILDIFATRARSQEARLQVELAQLEYSLPRLKNMWSHLSRLGGGGIGTRGPGETQLEEDRRIANMRIRDLKHKLNAVVARKEREVKSRGDMPTVSLVGYTNAGKSRLMNALTNADVYVENRLFSTLDTRTRQWHVKDFGKVLLSDTVGFIRDLPHDLVASFKATLAEARHARLLLHIVDASSPLAEEHIKAVNEVLTELDCRGKPTILVFNKIDAVTDFVALDVLRATHPHAVSISGLTGQGVPELTDAVIEALSTDIVPLELTFSAGDGKLLAFLNAHAEITHQEYRDGDVLVRCYYPRPLMHHLGGDGVRWSELPREFPSPAGDEAAAPAADRAAG